MRKLFLLQAISLLFGLGQTAPSPESDITPRATDASGPTCNTPSNRACWSDGFDIRTDYEVEIPNTGVTRSVSEIQPIRSLRTNKASMTGSSVSTTTGSRATVCQRALLCWSMVSVPLDAEVRVILTFSRTIPGYDMPFLQPCLICLSPPLLSLVFQCR